MALKEQRNQGLKPLPIEQWPLALKPIIDDMNGRPINVHSLMANNPALLQAWWNFRNYSVNGGSLGKRKAELVILRVSLHMQAWYEWGSHVERSLDCGISLEEINRINQQQPDNQWAQDEALLLTSVDQLIQNHRIEPKLVNSLNHFYSAEQVMDIIAIHGMYVILGCMINTWGLELDKHVNEKLPSSISKNEAVPKLI